eukprot:5400892-Pyramimonas_sp.AAC.1
MVGNSTLRTLSQPPRMPNYFARWGGKWGPEKCNDRRKDTAILLHGPVCRNMVHHMSYHRRPTLG